MDYQMVEEDTIKLRDGSKYIGEWRNGDMWNGTSYYKNGNIKGKFVNGMMIKPEPLL